MTAAFLVVLLLAVQVTAPPGLPTLLLPQGNGAWVVRIETSGGFTGRGLGNYTASSSGELKCLTYAQPAGCPEHLDGDTPQVLGRLVGTIPRTSDAPPVELSAPGRSMCNDCVTTTMSVRRRDADGEQTVTYRWDESTIAAVPGEVLRLRAAIMALASARAR